MATPKTRLSILSVAALLGACGLAATLLGTCGAENSEAPATSAPDPSDPVSPSASADQDLPLAPGPNLLLITVDSLRADRVGAYGHEAARTPILDGLAKEGARFTRAYAQVPWSLPAHASILTGSYPVEHGIHDNGRGALSDGVPTLAELFRERGRRTGAFIASLPLGRRFGLDRGFDVYDDDLGTPIGTRGQLVERKGGTVVASALEWLSSSADPFFAWVHLTDPRLRHDPPSAYAVMDDPYDGEIAYVDFEVGRLVEWVRADPARENTLIVAIASHGESLGEKGETAHGSLLYEGTQRIPLILSWPGRLPGEQVLDDLVEQADLLPTVAELCGWPTPQDASGRSVAPLLRGEELPPKAVYLENDHCALSFGWSTLRGVVEGQWKYIQAPTPELYDLAADPGEENNLAEDRPEVIASLEAKLKGRRADLPARPAGTLREPADPTRLLYHVDLTLSVGRGVVGEPGVGVNPIERIELLELYHDALRSGYLAQVDRMDGPLERIVTEYPEFVPAHLLQGELDTLRGRFKQAREQHQLAVDLDPENALAHFFLARAYQSEGSHAEATVHYQVAIELRPENVTARLPLARLLVNQKDVPAAIDQYREIVKAVPDQVRHWVNYANLLRDQGFWKETVEALKNATDLEPENWNNVNYYAWVLATAPDPEARNGLLAVEEAERMVQHVGPLDLTAQDTLAAAYAECGRWGRAQDTARTALNLAKTGRNLRLVQGLTDRLALYLEEKPYREEP